MATGIKKCRVCGKEYEYCHTLRRTTSNVFRWQKVACSYECGCIYLSRIKASREETSVDVNIEEKAVEEVTEDKDFDDFTEEYEAELNDYFDVTADETE